MDEFLKIFNKQTDNNFNFLKINNVNIDMQKSTVDLDFWVPENKYEFVNKEENFKVINEYTCQILKGYKVKIKFIKLALNEYEIKKLIFDYLEKEYLYIFKILKKSDVKINSLEYDKKIVTIFAYDDIYEYIKNKLVDKELSKYLSDFYCTTFDIRLEKASINNVDIFVEELQNYTPDITEENDIKISDEVPVIGKKITSAPKRISSITSVKQGVSLCGKIKLLTKRNYKDKPGGFFTFILDDYTSQISVKYFPKSENSESAFEKMIVGDSMVKCFGNIVIDKFTNKLSYMISNISLCDIDEESLKVARKYLKEKKNYQYVFPKKYVELAQINLLNDDIETKIPQSLIGKTYVVFDLETTGLNPYGNPEKPEEIPDRIIEIGAVKIVDGKFTEVFESLVNPKMHIPEEASNVNNITDAVVADAPDIKKVMPDFYKFTRKSVLIAHNANFDMSFIYKESKELNYNFDNEVIDTLELSRNNPILKKELTHFNLKSLCAYFKINQKEAHRACDDAVNTAKVFIKIKNL